MKRLVDDEELEALLAGERRRSFGRGFSRGLICSALLLACLAGFSTWRQSRQLRLAAIRLAEAAELARAAESKEQAEMTAELKQLVNVQGKKYTVHLGEGWFVARGR